LVAATKLRAVEVETRPCVEVETITQELAREWLANSVGNRALRPKVIRTLSKAMLDGKWRLNGEAIIFDTEGRLMDGHHRLTAVAQTGVTIQSFVTRGIPADCMATLDVGAKRSAGDYLTIQGEEYGSTLAPALRWLWRFEHGQLGIIRPSGVADAEEIGATLHKYPDFRNSISYGRAVQRTRLGHPSVFTFIHFVLQMKNAKAAHEFFEKLTKGTGLEDGDPLLVLRKRLTDNATARESKLHQEQVVAMTFRTWNHWRRGEKVTDGRAIMWHPEQSFPEAIK